MASLDMKPVLTPSCGSWARLGAAVLAAVIALAVMPLREGQADARNRRDQGSRPSARRGAAARLGQPEPFFLQRHGGGPAAPGQEACGTPGPTPCPTTSPRWPAPWAEAVDVTLNPAALRIPAPWSSTACSPGPSRAARAPVRPGGHAQPGGPGQDRAAPVDGHLEMYIQMRVALVSRAHGEAAENPPGRLWR